jgi:hypothetical protein
MGIDLFLIERPDGSRVAQCTAFPSFRYPVRPGVPLEAAKADVENALRGFIADEIRISTWEVPLANTLIATAA